jgi:hypothetical protein
MTLFFVYIRNNKPISPQTLKGLYDVMYVHAIFPIPYFVLNSILIPALFTKYSLPFLLSSLVPSHIQRQTTDMP